MHLLNRAGGGKILTFRLTCRPGGGVRRLQETPLERSIFQGLTPLCDASDKLWRRGGSRAMRAVILRSAKVPRDGLCRKGLCTSRWVRCMSTEIKRKSKTPQKEVFEIDEVKLGVGLGY
eukprot:380972-Amorphochlora_amoeboformis.AAC.1